MSSAKALPHHTKEDSGSTLRFVIPYRTQWLTTVSLAMGTLFVVFIFVIVAGAEITLVWAMGASALVLISPLSCLGGLIALGVGANEVVELLWQLMGQEVLEVRDDAITLRHQILGRGITRRYAADQIRRVWVLPHTDRGFTAVYTPGVSLFSRVWFGASPFRSFKRGPVAFQRGQPGAETETTVQFGSSLAVDEAQSIVASIHRKFPQYAQRASGAG
jgi:hypothetical protein